VLEVVRAYEFVSGHSIPYSIVGRRVGDVAECYADASHAERELGWKATLNIEVMCKDSWNWQLKNPSGYED
jgi:UDP-glucose 4-epimerase